VKGAVLRLRRKHMAHGASAAEDAVVIAETSTSALSCQSSLFVCEACCTSFPSRNALFRHLREKHEGDDVPTLVDPPSKKWEEDRQPAPQLHASVNAVKKDKKKNKKDPLQPAGQSEERKELHIKTRPHCYLEELNAKVKKMEELLHDFGTSALPATEVFESPHEHFRMRVEFDIFNVNDEPAYMMHAGKERIVVNDFPMGSKLICETLMPVLLRALREEQDLRQHLFQVNFHTTLHGDAMVSLLYRTPHCRAERRERMQQAGLERVARAAERDDGRLTAEWEAAATRLHTALSGASVVGRTRGKTRVIGRNWVQEQLQVVGMPAALHYRQLESFFSQSNATVCQHMLAWARAVAYSDDFMVGSAIAQARGDDLLELYCGNGNFCIALAPLFRKVLATELVKELLEATKKNAEDNGVTNISTGRVSAEELALALNGSRSFNRLEHIDLDSYDLRTVLVDPPRAGLGPQVSALLSSRFQRIVYISCNPDSLRDDLHELCRTHDIKRLAAFDQFAYTDHLEIGVLFVRRD